METFYQGLGQQNAPAPNVNKEFPFDERLSSWEMSQLWILYLANSSIRYILEYFYTTAQDPEIKALLNEAKNLAVPQLDTISNIFNSAGFPIPHGFSDEDVEPNAKRLFSDALMLSYLRVVNKYGLVKLGHVLPLVSRPDIRAYVNSATVEVRKFLNKTEDLLAIKGLAVKAPYIPVPDRVNYVSDDSWFGGGLGKKRSINVLELSHVFERMETKLAERAILLGFTQVAKDHKVKDYFSKGHDVLDKEVNKWSKVLDDEDQPMPPSWRGEVTDSSESPFSDKLMLFHFISMLTLSVAANGFALTHCNRMDLAGDFVKSIYDVHSYWKDGIELLIKKGWMEEIPLAADRKEIINMKQ
ncbi:Protein of unknown function (DUF3231) [Desulfosporosinus orientis DSM 765]|uniref:DUF3231 family protein n=1 Tax=Desulfosporosinus orientis (strain ATCC 19365 / DSM 765 / NCIMB 8382 / VKM B-1628 / Singapore I) TaxID=768706 RepID=G7W8Z4_DESOD|nr:DUF3231 family protein [Desulfosporosinus orientis]AET68203.1 Protein of unknown function (DUF3231) [Desulfosporosinus orientis DSM 765]